MAELKARPFEDGKRIALAGFGASVVGFALLGLGAAVDPARAAFSYLTAFAYVVSLQLGALVFLMIGHAAKASWMTPIRKITEAVASGLLVAPVLFVPVLLGSRYLYAWTREPLHSETLGFLPAKEAYLNLPFFAVRAAIYFAVWIALVLVLRRWSLQTDRDVARARDRGPATRASALGLPVLGLTLTFAAFDWLMSLEPAWFSTMFGIYYFAGGFVGAIALLTALAFAAERSGWLEGFFTGSHYHALGRLLLAFTIFWTYIAFFQLFLIYIANKPEEVTYYLRRIQGTWTRFDYVLLFGHFVLPFLVLLLRGIKFRPRLLVTVAGWIVFVHYLDVYWLVMPVLLADGASPHWLDLAGLLAAVGLPVSASVLLLRGQPVVPVNDPGLPEALHYRSA